jgi:hypothetical protein
MNETVSIDMSDVNDIKVFARTLVRLMDEGFDIEKVLVVGDNDLFELKLKK